MSEAIHLSSYVAGKQITSANLLEVKSPYDHRLVGTVVLEMQEIQGMPYRLDLQEERN